MSKINHGPLDANGMCRQCFRPMGEGDILPKSCILPASQEKVYQSAAVLEEFIRKYSGHWWLKTDEERAMHAISIVRNTLIIRNDEYTKGFIDACKKIEDKFNQLMKEKCNG